MPPSKILPTNNLHASVVTSLLSSKVGTKPLPNKVTTPQRKKEADNSSDDVVVISRKPALKSVVRAVGVMQALKGFQSTMPPTEVPSSRGGSDRPTSAAGRSGDHGIVARPSSASGTMTLNSNFPAHPPSISHLHPYPLHILIPFLLFDPSSSYDPGVRPPSAARQRGNTPAFSALIAPAIPQHHAIKTSSSRIVDSHATAQGTLPTF